MTLINILIQPNPKILMDRHLLTLCTSASQLPSILQHSALRTLRSYKMKMDSADRTHK